MQFENSTDKTFSTVGAICVLKENDAVVSLARDVVAGDDIQPLVPGIQRLLAIHFDLRELREKGASPDDFDCVLETAFFHKT